MLTAIATPAFAQAVTAPADTRAAERAEADRFLQERSAALAARFAAEPRDAAWAAAASAAIRKALAESGEGGRRLKATDIDCRSRTCRVALNASHAAALSERLPRLALRLTETFESMDIGHDERVTTEAVSWVYFSR